MKTKIIIPFDLETAKKIQAGEIRGKIKTRDLKDVDEIAFFRTHQDYCIYATIDGFCHSFTKEGYERGWDKSCKYSGDLVLEVPIMFKPFDRVLVRSNDNHDWQCAIFSHCAGCFFVANTSTWSQCIPYEGNEHLVGTTNKPEGN